MDEPEGKEKKKYTLAHIKPLHKELARRLVLGQKPMEIWRDLNISPEHIRTLMKSPLFKIELAKLEEKRDKGVVDVTKTLHEISPLALEQIERLMYTATTETLKFKAAESILDRAGYGSISKGSLDIRKKVDIKYSDLTEMELKKLLAERIMNAEKQHKIKKALEEEASAIEVEFEDEPEEEKSKPKPIKMLMG